MRGRLLVLVLAVGAVPLLAGCELLRATDPGFDGDFGKALATYTTGRATIEIDGKTIVLDKLNAGPHLYEQMGTDVYWYNDDGWGLRLNSFSSGLMGSSDVTIDRVRTTYWSAPGYGDCVVKVEKADETGVKGTAKCDGLRWVDQLRGGSFMSGGPPYVEGEPAFDATITFKAAPAGGTAASASPKAPPSATPGASGSATSG